MGQLITVGARLATPASSSARAWQASPLQIKSSGTGTLLSEIRIVDGQDDPAS
jgi:hypothetical protein